MHREILAAQSLGPLEAELVHEGLAALSRALAQGATRRDGLLQHRANRRVHGAEEELEVQGALHFHQGVELVHLQSGVLLIGVTQKVRHNGLIVGDVRTERYRYGLAETVLGDGDALLSMVLAAGELQGQDQKKVSRNPATVLHFEESCYLGDGKSFCVTGSYAFKRSKTPRLSSCHGTRGLNARMSGKWVDLGRKPV